VINDLDLRRQEVSGVNLDEEVTTLVQVQKAFDASARVITITDRMLDTLLGIVR
jgi:flagellar hook-associated protein 1 FlgK